MVIPPCHNNEKERRKDIKISPSHLLLNKFKDNRNLYQQLMKKHPPLTHEIMTICISLISLTQNGISCQVPPEYLINL